MRRSTRILGQCFARINTRKLHALDSCVPACSLVEYTRHDVGLRLSILEQIHMHPLLLLNRLWFQTTTPLHP